MSLFLCPPGSEALCLEHTDLFLLWDPPAILGPSRLVHEGLSLAHCLSAHHSYSPKTSPAPTHHHSLSLILQEESESPHLTPGGRGQLSQSLQAPVFARKRQGRQERNGGTGSIECPMLGSIHPKHSPRSRLPLSGSYVNGPWLLKVLRGPWYPVFLHLLGAQGLGVLGPIPTLHGTPEAACLVPKGSAVLAF